MKKITLLFAFVGYMLINANAQEPTLPSEIEALRLKNMGLVSQLSFIKGISEAIASPIVAGDIVITDENEKKKFIKDYTYLKILVDQLINQMKTDLVIGNKVGLYRKINKKIKYDLYSSKNKRAGEYLSNILIINKNFTLFVDKVTTSLGNTAFEFKSRSSIAPTDIFDIIYGGIEQGLAFEAAIREARKAKVDGITAILNDLKLADPKSFKEAKEDAKKDPKVEPKKSGN